MKTAILTFQDAENYGAALQAFALKKTCEIFSNVEVLNYYNPYFHRLIRENKLKILIKKFINKNKDKNKIMKFKNFQKDYIVGQMKLLYKDDLKKIDGNYDYFITGSDQVWNLECSGNDTSYFLDFVKISKKVSYAASFGASSCSNQIVESMLKDYYRISVRETSGQKIIKQILGVDVPVVLDPTLLLDRNDWADIFNLNFREDYVLVYEVLTGDSLFEQAKDFAKEKGLELICITSSNRIRFGATIIKDAGPIEWLELFAGARYVFTNSFHGLAFSLNFNKQFFVELLPPPAKTNTRIIELLKKTNLVCRDSSKANKLDNIDYKIINSILNKEKNTSLNYLNSLYV